ncbi:hypothetical protein HDE_03791 [Halotydeus destructor]|nr:hypothetical protein HDE_03791 [Halotydeus destructor]
MSDSRMTVLALVLATLMTTVINETIDSKCAAQAVESDACLAHALLIGETKVDIPRTMEQLETFHCSRIRSEYKCISAYKVCLKGVAKMMFNSITRNFNNEVVKKQCGTDQGRADFIKHFNCFDQDSLQYLHDVVNKLTLSIELVRDSANSSQLAGVCCAFQHTMAVGRQLIDGLCREKTGPETAEYVVGMLDNILKEVVQMGCNGYDTTDVCDTKMAPLMAQFRAISDSGPNHVHLDHTPMIPLLQVVAKLQTRR